MKGFCLFHRTMLNHPMLKRGKIHSPWEAFSFLILQANHKDRNVPIGMTLYNVKRGQLITSQKKLCKEFGWGNTRLRNWLKLMESDDMIKVETETNLTRISILKYDTYQSPQIDNKLQSKPKQTTSKSSSTTNNNVNNEKNVNKRLLTFTNNVLAEASKFKPMLESNVCDEFIDYWSELNKSKTKMKWELQKTFEISRRLKRWISNDFGRKTKTQVKKTFKFSTTMKHVLGYCGNRECSKFGHSDFYDPWRAERGLEETKCCGTELLTKRIS